MYSSRMFAGSCVSAASIEWMPKIQAKAFRLQDAVFELNTPKAAKEKLRAAVPAGGTVVIYKTVDEFNAVVRNKTELEWIQHELRSISTSNSGIAKN